MSTPANTCSARMVTAVSAARNPAVGVITSAPLPVSGRSGSGGRANSSAYASLPRKYSPLTKANTSPSATPRFSRNRTARSNCARSDITILARGPEQLAGERRKMRGGTMVVISRDPGSGIRIDLNRQWGDQRPTSPRPGPRLFGSRTPDHGSRPLSQTPAKQHSSNREAGADRGEEYETSL